MGTTEERAARNESVFRDANERIAMRRAELEAVDGATPFLCECEDDECTEVIRLTLEEYERVRAVPEQFVIATGHPTSGVPTSTAGDGWTCVRKTGGAAEVARETDPRS